MNMYDRLYNAMKKAVAEGMVSGVNFLAQKGEYGWNGWLGTYFSNEPSCGITTLMGIQRIGGDTGTLARKLKNIVMCEAM